MAGLDEPFHIPLPGFSQKKADIYQQALITCLERHNSRIQELELDVLEPIERAIKPFKGKFDKISDVLGGLWKDIVKPILDALAFPVSVLCLV